MIMNDTILDEDFAQKGNRRYYYPGFWNRVGASIIDVIVMIPLIILIFVNMVYWRIPGLEVVLTFVALAYKPFFEYQYGATPGKMVLKMKVVNQHYEPLTLSETLLRNILYIISGLIGLYESFVHFFLLLDEEPYFSSLDEYANQPTSPLESLFNLIVFISCIFVAFTRDKQALHDMWANTFCIWEEK